MTLRFHFLSFLYCTVEFVLISLFIYSVSFSESKIKAISIDDRVFQHGVQTLCSIGVLIILCMEAVLLAIFLVFLIFRDVTSEGKQITISPF